MTVNERLEDISRISGFSVEIIRKIQQAELESILNSLKKGERATLIGRCTIEPCIRSKIQPGGGIVDYIKAKASVSHVISDALGELTGFETSDSESSKLSNQPGVAAVQIPSLV